MKIVRKESPYRLLNPSIARSMAERHNEILTTIKEVDEPIISYGRPFVMDITSESVLPMSQASSGNNNSKRRMITGVGMPIGLRSKLHLPVIREDHCANVPVERFVKTGEYNNVVGARDPKRWRQTSKACGNVRRLVNAEHGVCPRYLNFVWKCEIVEHYVANKEGFVKSTNFGYNIASVEMLLDNQCSFKTRLTEFAVRGK